MRARDFLSEDYQFDLHNDGSGLSHREYSDGVCFYMHSYLDEPIGGEDEWDFGDVILTRDVPTGEVMVTTSRVRRKKIDVEFDAMDFGDRSFVESVIWKLREEGII